MEYNIYIHRYVRDILSQFGDINTVVNHIVDEGMRGKFNIYALDKAPPRTTGDMCQYTITILNKEYNELVQTHGNRSSTVSLRRIIYHFVDNELYEELGWKTIAAPSLDRYTVILARLGDTTSQLNTYVPLQHRPLYNEVVQAVRRLINAQRVD